MKPNELIEWLNERGADKPCPACDANDWLGESDPDDRDLLAIVGPISLRSFKDDDGNSFSQVVNYDAYMVSCKNCGFIRLHNKKIVEGQIDG